MIGEGDTPEAVAARKTAWEAKLAERKDKEDKKAAALRAPDNTPVTMQTLRDLGLV